MRTLAIWAPLESVTAPEIPPLSAWAKHTRALDRAITARRDKALFLMDIFNLSFNQKSGEPNDA
jgi:ABC-type cobalamin transport system ATPase subunit